ncbi:hypothetical protein VTJ49DRAFT_6832 [Mycothermus thermophilus]|uniref:Uncharacterized protein n=1 Tax=Humicola insolens TaxID=85995 RepID=A0ABR3VQP9_HUMIN
MLSHGLAGAASSVCLQCRLRLSRASRWPPSPIPRTAVSTPKTARRCFSRSPDPSSDPGEYENTDPETHPGTNPPSHDGYSDLDIDQSSEPDRPYYNRPLRGPPLGPRRTYKSKGHVLSPQREKLAVDILGKPGSAIVLREKFAVRKREPEPEPTSVDASKHAVDPSTLLHEPTPLAGEEVMRHLDELRPKDPAPLTDAEFNKLIDNLVQGFTRVQLKQYLEYHDKVSREQKRRAAEHQPWLLESRPWMPTVESPARDIEPHLRGYITKGMAPKRRLAIRLVRECWNVENENVMVGDGILTMRLRDVEFELLTFGNKRWFEGTQRHILAQVKEVRLVRDTQRVSIVATRHAAERIVERIHDVLSRCRTSEFPVDLVSSEPLDPGVLQELGRVTHTVIRLNRSGKKVIVTWIHQAQRSEDFETACDTVKRLLQTTAVFGHAGFARPNPVLSSSPSKLDTSCPRTFLPALPALGSLKLLRNLQETGLWHTTIVIRFTPSQDNAPDLKISAPDLELRIDADHREIKELLCLRAIQSTFVGDVLFPAATVDARLIQHRFFHLPGAGIESRVPAIIEFLSKSNLRPWDGKMSTPRSIPGIRLPRHLLNIPKNQPNSSDPTATTNTDETNASNDFVELDYSFTSIEIHRTVAGDYEGLKMRYTSIQPGQRGGARAELSLEAVHIDPDAMMKATAHQSGDNDSSHYKTNNTTTAADTNNKSNSITALREDLTNGPQPIPFTILRNIDQNNDPDAAWDVEDEVDVGGGSGGGAVEDEAQWMDEHRTLFEEEYAPTRRTPIPVRPVKTEQFLAAVSDIVNEQGPLRWYAKRFDHETRP